MHHESGSAISEFLFIAPILCLLLAITMYANGHLSTAQRLDLATRNLAFSLSPIPVQVQADSADSPKEFRALDLSEEDYHSEKTESDSISDRVKFSFKDTLPLESTYELIDDTEGRLTNLLLPIVLALKNQAKLADLDLLEDDFMTETRVSVQDDSWSVYGQSIASFMNQPTPGHQANARSAQAAQEKWSSLSLWSDHHHRYNDGFHPNAYRNQGLMGYALGLQGDSPKWSSPHQRSSRITVPGHSSILDGDERSFTSECMMNFIGNSQCKFTNWLALTQRFSYITWGLLDYVPYVNTAKQGFSQTAQALYEQAGTLIIEKMTSEVVRRIEDKVQDEIGKRIEETAMGQITKFEDKIADELSEKVEDPFSGALE